MVKFTCLQGKASQGFFSDGERPCKNQIAEKMTKEDGIKNFILRTNSKFFLSCFLVNILLFVGLLTTDRLYIDDIGRSVSGESGWSGVGRPLADMFITFIQLGTPLNNSFPLPQIISICMISLTCMLLSQTYSIKSPIIAAICTLPLAGQPYYLENMSYSFDSPSMALGLSLSVCAAMSLADKKREGFIISVVLAFMALNLYQPSIGAFFVTYIFLVIKNINIEIKPHKYFLAHITRLITGSGLAFLLYVPVVRKFAVADYAIEHSKLIGLHNAYDKIFGNTANYIGALIRDWSGNTIGYIFVFIFVSFLVVSIFQAIWSGHRFSINKRTFLYAVLSLVFGVLTVIVSYFPQMLLENPLLFPRVFVGFGAILSCCCLYVWSTLEANNFGLGKYEQYIKAIPVCLVAYALITFSYSYSRANAAQRQYEDIVIGG
ncbi:MAG TPA: glucosyltransferase domain-containing protein, partial [Thermodesulfovibrionales bacterium]|nr:glucosyltransferase domain-containing protein [Thermodesulfovibrionales bacterium]